VKGAGSTSPTLTQTVQRQHFGGIVNYQAESAEAVGSALREFFFLRKIRRQVPG